MKLIFFASEESITLCRNKEILTGLFCICFQISFSFFITHLTSWRNADLYDRKLTWKRSHCFPVIFKDFCCWIFWILRVFYVFDSRFPVWPRPEIIQISFPNVNKMKIKCQHIYHSRHYMVQCKDIKLKTKVSCITIWNIWGDIFTMGSLESKTFSESALNIFWINSLKASKKLYMYLFCQSEWLLENSYCKCLY